MTQRMALFLGLVLLLFAVGIFVWKRYPKGSIWFLRKAIAIKNALLGYGPEDQLDEEALENAIKTAGYAYDSAQDIFYSRKDAWQRSMGYCRLYDEASATFGMIIDCEPIYFEYDGKKWLIEFWKGQYDLTTGCEIGVYVTDRADIDITDAFRGTFYQCASDKDLLDLGYCLIKNQKPLFSGYDKHWWLTGFQVGEFSEPSELTMNIGIVLNTKQMRDAFLQGMYAAGYLENEIGVIGNRISFLFDKPRTQQPLTRTKPTDELTQRKNELLCEAYQSITGPYHSFPEKMNAIKRQAPWLYKKILNLGKGEQFLHIYGRIMDSLGQ
jgi:hypothetical protein